MGNVAHTLKPTFAGGEFAPSLYARVDLQKYYSGLKRARNVIVHPHGGVSNRPGTEFIAETKDSARASRLIPFIFSARQAYQIEFGNEYCRFYTAGGQLALATAEAWESGTAYAAGDYADNGGTIYYCVEAHTSGTFLTDLAAGYWVAQTILEVPTPYSADDVFGVRYAQSADVLYMDHQSYPPKKLVRYGNTDWRLEEYAYVNGPFRAANLTSTTLAVGSGGDSTTLTASAAVFNEDHVGALFKLVHDIPGDSVMQSFSGTGTSATVRCGGTWRLVTHGTWSATFRIEKSVDLGSTWTTVREFRGAADINHNTYGDVADGPCLLRLRCTAYSSGTLQADLTTDAYAHTGIVRVTGYTSSTQVSVTVLDEVGSTDATSQWAEGAWSDYRGYPAVPTFHDDRLVHAGSIYDPMTIWMTETSNYSSFARNSPLLDSDGITINLPSRQLNGINNMISLVDLMVFTAASEWVVAPVSGEVLTPTTSKPTCYGYRGSAAVAPIIIGNRVVFIEPMGSTVRDIGFTENGGLDGMDLSIISNHLFNGHTIVDMAYQQAPDSLVWCVRNDGILLSMTYMKEHDVVAWTWHDTDGYWESVSTIPGDGYHETWFVVRRGEKRFVERMVKRMASADARQQWFVDCALKYDVPMQITGATQANPVVVTCVGHGLSTGDMVDILNVGGMAEINERRFEVNVVDADTFELLDEEDGTDVDGTAFTAYTSGGYARRVVSAVSGLGHLEGRTVAVLANGNVETRKVVSGGAITLDNPSSIVIAGLPYVAQIQTLDVEMMLDDGTVTDRLIKIPRVTIDFYQSRGGWVGPDEDNLDEITPESYPSLGQPLDLSDEEYQQVLNSTYDNHGSFFFEQRDPLPFTIRALKPKVVIGG